MEGLRLIEGSVWRGAIAAEIERETILPYWTGFWSGLEAGGGRAGWLRGVPGGSRVGGGGEFRSAMGRGAKIGRDGGDGGVWERNGGPASESSGCVDMV